MSSKDTGYYEHCSSNLSKLLACWFSIVPRFNTPLTYAPLSPITLFLLILCVPQSLPTITLYLMHQVGMGRFF
jgi:hypothetical protein